MWATHIYPFSHKTQPNWQAYWGFLTETAPVFISEFGLLRDADSSCSQTIVQDVIDEANSKGLSWTAWAWYVADSCAFPSAISDWSGNPSGWGNLVRNAL